jgi:hypothetical protein
VRHASAGYILRTFQRAITRQSSPVIGPVLTGADLHGINSAGTITLNSTDAESVPQSGNHGDVINIAAQSTFNILELRLYRQLS